MIVAGLGCRRGCAAEAVVAVVERAVRELGRAVDALAAPAFKRDEAGIREAAVQLGLRVVFVSEEALAAVQALCPTRSAVALRVTGHGSVAEAAALAVSGGPLLLCRIGTGPATCAIAGTGGAGTGGE